MYYAFIDTNIFVRVMSQGKPGCESELFDNLRTLVGGKALSLIIPEIVKFEIERHIRDLPLTVRQHFGDLKRVISTTSVWSEIQDAKESLLTELDTLRDEKIESWKKLHQEVTTFLESDKVASIPFTPEIMCRTRARIMRGAMPNPSSRRDQDAAIIESLITYFSQIIDSEPILFFCSENHTDFALELTEGKTKDRTFVLHPVLAADLPKSHFFTSLDELLRFDQGYESLHPPPQDAEMSRAIARLEHFEIENDYESDQYFDAWGQVQTLHDERLIQIFANQVLPKLPEEFRQKRQCSIEMIQHLLAECRECKSWDDRSEYKLSQWIEYLPEHMIPYTSLSKLLRIEESLMRYLSIHREMDSNRTHR